MHTFIFFKSKSNEYKTFHQWTVTLVLLQQREAVLPVDSIQCIMQSEIVLYSRLKINSVLEYAPAENNWRVRARNNSFLRDLFPWKSKGFLTWILKAEGHSYLLTDRERGLATGAREDLWQTGVYYFDLAHAAESPCCSNGLCSLQQWLLGGAGRAYQSQIRRLQLIFFLPLWVGLGSNPVHHSLQSDFHLCAFWCEKIRTIPWLQNPSPGHLLFLHWCKLFFLTSVLFTADIWGCLQPLTLVPYNVTSTPGVLGGCYLAQQNCSAVFCMERSLCSLSSENSAGALWEEHFLWIGGQMSPTSDILLPYLWGKIP